jgi:hypothetical protein
MHEYTTACGQKAQIIGNLLFNQQQKTQAKAALVHTFLALMGWL